MNIIEATKDRIVRPVAGAERTFIFLNAYDRAELLREDFKHRMSRRELRRQRLVENLKLAEITGPSMFAELEQFDDQEPEITEQSWLDLVNNPLNEAAIFVASLRKTYPTDAEKIASEVTLPLSERLSFRASLCGLVIVNQAEAEAEGLPTGPNAAAPGATYATPATTETGDSPKPESAIGSPV